MSNFSFGLILIAAFFGSSAFAKTPSLPRLQCVSKETLIYPNGRPVPAVMLEITKSSVLNNEDIVLVSVASPRVIYRVESIPFNSKPMFSIQSTERGLTYKVLEKSQGMLTYLGFANGEARAKISLSAREVSYFQSITFDKAGLKKLPLSAGVLSLELTCQRPQEP